jgi:hypothetical protein
MASTIQKKSLTVTINETVDLGSNSFNGRTQFKISNINEVSQRVITVPTHQVTLLQLSSSAAGGTYMSSSLQYARVSNLDNSNYVRLTFTSGSNSVGGGNQYDVKLDPLKTFVFMNDAYSGSATLGTFDTFASFTSLKAIANSTSVDVEVYVASA